MRKLLSPLLVLTLALGAALIGCGGGDDGKKSDQAPAASATEKGGGAATSKLANLKGFEYDMTISGFGELLGAAGGTSPGTAGPAASGEFKVKGAYQAPDRSSFTLNLGGQELSNVIIGKDQWVKVGGTWLGPTPASGDAKESVLAIAFWDDSFGTKGGILSCANAKNEKVNGVDAQHCGLDTQDVRKLADAFGRDSVDFGDLRDFKLDVWLAKDGGYPVRFEFSGTDSKANKPIGLKFELRNVNGNVRIDAPKS